MKNFTLIVLIILFSVSWSFAQTRQIDQTNPTPAPIFWRNHSKRMSIGEDKVSGVDSISPAPQLHLSLQNYGTNKPNNGFLISSKWCANLLAQGHRPLPTVADTSAYLFRIAGLKTPSGTGNTDCSYQNVLFNVDAYGRVSIGSNLSYAQSTNSQNNFFYRLYVQSGIRTERIYIDAYNGILWADYVFKPGYKLMPLGELEQYILKFKHLPEVPSEAEVKANGFELVDFNVILLKKIEELTLYMIELDKEGKELAEKVAELEKKAKSK
jgi:hypothetical protein